MGLGTPGYHPFFHGMFHEINHPAMGYLHVWKPPDPIGISMRLSHYEKHYEKHIIDY